jgi:hypothetical protein
MSKYVVAFSTHAATYVEVEADSPEEARERADETFEAPFICAQCSGWGQSTNLELGDSWEQDESDGGVWLA